jgi:histidinol-phosphate aminotransferase
MLFGKFADSHQIWSALLDRGVLVRETGPPQWLRVSIGTAAENATFLAELKSVLDVGAAAVLP